ncbi:MAG: CRISPR-associated endonuclease Cas1 [Bacteroidetes bacterium]|nr:MAG: CRISPR-associated endonuclease Cas1 [Bacteroidota bacterium]
MSIVALKKQNIKIKKISKRLSIFQEENKISELRVDDIDSIINFGNVQFSSQALNLLANNGVSVSFLSMDGKLKGQFIPLSNKNSDLAFKQYGVLLDNDKLTFLHKQFLIGKIMSCINFANEITKNHHVPSPAKKYKRYINAIERESNYEALLGYEGRISRIHFEFYDKCFTKELKFVKRTKRPPENEVNALLSFIYVLLFQLINSMLIASGFDTYIGFLHKPKYGRPSLALDVMELFRANFADRLVLRLCNKSIINKSHFEKNNFMLTDEGLKKVMQQYKALVYDDRPNKNLIDQIQQCINLLIKYIRYEEDINFYQVAKCI